MAPPALATPRRLGAYELGERLGAGGMAEVFVARFSGARGFQKKVAVKCILSHLASDARFVAMFSDEARIVASLAHPNIVQVVDFGEQDGVPFMAMEFVDGISCARLVRALAARGEAVPLAAALYIAQEVLRALAYAHEATDDVGRPLGIVHRDVSPGNLLLGRAGEVKLTDFGILRSSSVDRRTYPGELKGKLGYMSPEQVAGREVDARSDLFSLGVVLAELVLLRPLFPGRTELEILTRIHHGDLAVLDRYAPALPGELVVLLRRLLERDPRARFASAREALGALRAVAAACRATLSDSELLPWLSGLGLLPSQSGLREAVSRPTPSTIAARPLGDHELWNVGRFDAPRALYRVVLARRRGLLTLRGGGLVQRLALAGGGAIAIDPRGGVPGALERRLARIVAAPQVEIEWSSGSDPVTEVGSGARVAAALVTAALRSAWTYRDLAASVSSSAPRGVEPGLGDVPLGELGLSRTEREVLDGVTQRISIAKVLEQAVHHRRATSRDVLLALCVGLDSRAITASGP